MNKTDKRTIINTHFYLNLAMITNHQFIIKSNDKWIVKKKLNHSNSLNSFPPPPSSPHVFKNKNKKKLL